MNPAELRNGAKIRLVPRCQHAESNVFAQPLLQTTRRENAHAIAVNQNLGHHPGGIRRIAALLALVVALDRVQVQLIDQVGDEIRQVVLGQPLTQTRRKKKILLRKIRPVNLRHTPRLAASPPAIQALSCTNFALLRRAPSFCIRNCRVGLLIPRRTAAPFGPPKTQFVCSRTDKICLLSTSSRVANPFVSPSSGMRNLRSADGM